MAPARRHHAKRAHRRKGKPASTTQKRFMKKALERGYVPLTPKQVRYFETVVHGHGRRKPARRHKARAGRAGHRARRR